MALSWGLITWGDPPGKSILALAWRLGPILCRAHICRVSECLLWAGLAFPGSRRWWCLRLLSRWWALWTPPVHRSHCFLTLCIQRPISCWNIQNIFGVSHLKNQNDEDTLSLIVLRIRSIFYLSQHLFTFLCKINNNGMAINRQLAKEIQIANKYMKRWSFSLVIGKMQIKTTLRHHFIHQIGKN